MIILPVILAQVHAGDIRTNHATDAQDFVDKMVDILVDKLIGRVLNPHRFVAARAFELPKLSTLQSSFLPTVTARRGTMGAALPVIRADDQSKVSAQATTPLPTYRETTPLPFPVDQENLPGIDETTPFQEIKKQRGPPLSNLWPPATPPPEFQSDEEPWDYEIAWLACEDALRGLVAQKKYLVAVEAMKCYPFDAVMKSVYLLPNYLERMGKILDFVPELKKFRAIVDLAEEAFVGNMTAAATGAGDETLIDISLNTFIDSIENFTNAEYKYMMDTKSDDERVKKDYEDVKNAQETGEDFGMKGVG